MAYGHVHEERMKSAAEARSVVAVGEGALTSRGGACRK